MNSVSKNSTQQALVNSRMTLHTGGSMKISLAEAVKNMRGAGMSYGEAIHQFQERYISLVLAKHKGHLGETAEELNIHRNTLSRALAELNLDVAQIRRDTRPRPVDAIRKRNSIPAVKQFEECADPETSSMDQPLPSRSIEITP